MCEDSSINVRKSPHLSMDQVNDLEGANHGKKMR